MTHAAKRMLPADVKEARALLGVSQGGLAELVGVHERTVRRWEIEEKGAPRTASAAISRLVELSMEAASLSRVRDVAANTVDGDVRRLRAAAKGEM